MEVHKRCARLLQLNVHGLRTMRRRLDQGRRVAGGGLASHLSGALSPYALGPRCAQVLAVAKGVRSWVADKLTTPMAPLVPMPWAHALPRSYVAGRG